MITNNRIPQKILLASVVTISMLAAALLFPVAIFASSEPGMQSTPKQTEHHNRLVNESSPYLQQHATNPINWYPWGQEAFEAAKREDKPIFLSIGYSTCVFSLRRSRVCTLMNFSHQTSQPTSPQN